MSKNPSCRCQCDTVPPFPDCFGCPVFVLPDLPNEVTLEFSGVSWPGPVGTTSGQHNLTFPPPPSPCGKSTSYFNFRALDITQLNAALPMRVNPGYGSTMSRLNPPACFWLWNDVVAVNSVWIDGNRNSPTFIAELHNTFYEPLNPIDSTSPWGREYVPNTDPRCLRFSAGWNCCQIWDQAIEVSVFPMQINITNPTLGYFTEGSGVFHWVVDVFFRIGRDAINYLGGTATCPGPFGPWDGGGNLRVTSPCNGMRTSYSPTQAGTSGPASNPPYWGNHGTGVFTHGGLICSYIKEIDCDNDFSGDPLTLNFANRASSAKAFREAWGFTMPSTVELTYPV